MTRAPYRIHRMIQDLMADPDAAKRFAQGPDATFDRYNITEAERGLLRDGSPKALQTLGIHPNLQMKYFKIRKAPNPGGGGAPLAYYLERLKGRD